MRNLLVTGGAGFIGANFVHYWLKKHPEDRVWVLDVLTYAGNLKNLQSLSDDERFEFVRGDIRDMELVRCLLRRYRIDTLVHFAAESHVDRSISGPDAFIDTNIVGTHSLLKVAKAEWLDEGRDLENHRFHHVSTDEVYGSLQPCESPFSEMSPYMPNSPYAASKAASDHLVRAYHHTYGLQVSISNCSNNYGPYQFPEKLIPLMITHILHDQSLPVYGDGRQIRDWLYVEDHCRGIDLILNASYIGECFNIGGSNEWANIDIVKCICKLMNEAFDGDPALAEKYPAAHSAIAGLSENLITFVKDRPGHDRRYAIDATKAGRLLSYRPCESFETGIRKTIRWYLKNGGR